MGGSFKGAGETMGAEGGYVEGSFEGRVGLWGLRGPIWGAVSFKGAGETMAAEGDYFRGSFE